MVDEQQIVCANCGEELNVGSWPWCPHTSIYSQSAAHFDAIVVHRGAEGNYRFPASVDAPVPEGYRKVEIRTIQEADRITREVNAREDVTLRTVQAQSDGNRDATRLRNRAFMNSMREKMSPAGREFLDRAREYQAQKDQDRANHRPRGTNFHMDVFANDSSNREAHRDERTGWRPRKG